MAESKQGSGDIRETDIVFDCPHCGKSLAVDYRAAGLTVPCTDCGESLSVPIPDGMELSDLDTTDEDREALVIRLRETIQDTQTRVRLLEAMVDEMRERRKVQAQKEEETSRRMDAIMREVEVITRAVDQISASLGNMSQALVREG